MVAARVHKPVAGLHLYTVLRVRHARRRRLFEHPRQPHTPELVVMLNLHDLAVTGRGATRHSCSIFGYHLSGNVVNKERDLGPDLLFHAAAIAIIKIRAAVLLGRAWLLKVRIRKSLRL